MSGDAKQQGQAEQPSETEQLRGKEPGGLLAHPSWGGIAGLLAGIGLLVTVVLTAAQQNWWPFNGVSTHAAPVIIRAEIGRRWYASGTQWPATFTVTNNGSDSAYGCRLYFAQVDQLGRPTSSGYPIVFDPANATFDDPQFSLDAGAKLQVGGGTANIAVFTDDPIWPGIDRLGDKAKIKGWFEEVWIECTSPKVASPSRFFLFLPDGKYVFQAFPSPSNIGSRPTWSRCAPNDSKCVMPSFKLFPEIIG